MAEPDLALATTVVELARRAGAGQCDVIIRESLESKVQVRLGEVEQLIESGSRSLGLRVITDGRTAVCSTADLDPAALARFARETVDLAAISAPDECAGLPAASETPVPLRDGLQLYDESLANLSVEEKVHLAVTCEAAARGADARITNSGGASFSTRIAEVSLANSNGFAGRYPATAVGLGVEVMADDSDGKKRTGGWSSSERSLHRLLDAEEIGRIAARRAVMQLGARKVGTKAVPVVFEPVMTVALMANLLESATGSALYRGATFLAGRVGERVGSSLLNIIDDPLLPGRLGSRPFDGEGVGVHRTALIEDGIFGGFLFDVYTGRRTGNRTTGSAVRGVESLPAPGPSNLIFEAGSTDPAAIIAGVEDGLYLTTLFGFGFNPATGDFSRGAAGYWIEHGELAYPVTEINVSGRLETMFAGIDAVGNDLTWFGSAAAPTIRVREMTVSGL